jgi:hypothetical protein
MSINWKNELEEGILYSRAAEGLKKNRKVDNETLYHIICLSVEKFLASLAGMVNYIPMHSGLTFVARELGKKMEFPENYFNEVRFLSGFMTYCSLDFEKPKVISEVDLARMIGFMADLKNFTQSRAINPH